MKTKTSQNLDPHVQRILDLIEEKKGQNTILLDASEAPLFTDYIVITSADNSRQLKGIASNIKTHMPEEPYGFEGVNSQNWIVLDYGDVIIHVFDEDARRFYDLEGLWGELLWESGD